MTNFKEIIYFSSTFCRKVKKAKIPLKIGETYQNMIYINYITQKQIRLKHVKTHTNFSKRIQIHCLNFCLFGEEENTFFFLFNLFHLISIYFCIKVTVNLKLCVFKKILYFMGVDWIFFYMGKMQKDTFFFQSDLIWMVKIFFCLWYGNRQKLSHFKHFLDKSKKCLFVGIFLAFFLSSSVVCLYAYIEVWLLLKIRYIIQDYPNETRF